MPDPAAAASDDHRSSAPTTASRLRLAPRATVHLRHRNPAVRYEVDCRMLFLGERIHTVPRAFDEISYHFAATAEPARRFRRLTESAEIQQHYHVQRTVDGVSVRLRDSIFGEPAKPDDLELVLAVSGDAPCFEEPFPATRWRTLGALLPLLSGRFSRERLLDRLPRDLSNGERDWAARFVDRLDEHGLLVEHPAADGFFDRPADAPRVTLVGHSSLLVQSPRGALLIDPVLRAALGTPERAFDLTRMDLDGIVCSHAHWDHCDLETLLRFDKRTPIVVPRVRRPTAFNPPIATALARLGFHDVREADHWSPLRIGDFEIVPVPFRGEQDEPGAEIDHFTYVVRIAGLCLYGAVDSHRDGDGDMLEVLDRVRSAYRPDVAFVPVSKMVYEYRTGGVNGFCRVLDDDRYASSFQYTASAADAAQWIARLQPAFAAPYAVFAFPRWSASRESAEFARELRAMGLGRRLAPLRPLEALDRVDLAGGPRAAIRRGRRAAVHGLGEGLRRLDERGARHRAYRVLRRIARAVVADLRRGLGR